MKRKTVIMLLACCMSFAAPAVCAPASETEAAAQSEAVSGQTETEQLPDETEEEFEEEPEFDISDYLQITDDKYKSLTVEVSPVEEVTQEEIDDEIAAEAADAGLDEVTEGTVADGDTVNIDYVGKKDGTAFDGGTANGYDLEIGSGTFIDGFEEGLIGKKIGDTVDLDLTFPEDYGNSDLAGQAVVFTVTINYVHRTPEVTDDFASEISDGAYKTAEEYEASVKEQLEETNKEAQTDEIYSAIYEQLVALYPIEKYPQENIDFYVDTYVSQMESVAEDAGESLDDYLTEYYGVDEAYFREYYTTYAQQMLQQRIILGAIAEKEGITLADDEFQTIMEGYADQYGVTVDELLSYYSEKDVRESELENKVMEYLASVTTVREVEETEYGTEADYDFDADAESAEVYDADVETEDVEVYDADAETEA